MKRSCANCLWATGVKGESFKICVRMPPTAVVDKLALASKGVGEGVIAVFPVVGESIVCGEWTLENNCGGDAE